MTCVSNEAALKKLHEGTKLMTYPVDKAKLDASVACFEDAISLDAGMAFHDALAKRTGFPKAWSRMGYALILCHIEGFRPPSVLTDAGDFIDIAISQNWGKLDYEPYWDRASFYLYTDKFDDAIKSVNRAMELDPRDTDVIVEAADIHVAAGDHDTAMRLLAKAGRLVNHDWYRWSKAWAMFFKAQKDASYYDLAIAELRQMYWRPGEQQYMHDAELLLAAIYAQKGDMKKARQSFNLFKRFKTKWALDDEKRSRPFRNPADFSHWQTACRKARDA